MVGIGLTMLAGIALVGLSLEVMLPVTAHADPVAREDIALALSVVLLGLLMMVTRRNAVSQVVGFMSLENGINLAATGAQGMPLVVEISVAFSILIAFIVIGIFLFRIRERFDTVDLSALDRVPRRALMNELGRSCSSRCSPPRSWRVVPGYRLSGAHQHDRQPGGVPRRRVVVLVAAGGRPVPAGRRPERRLHRAEQFRRASPPARSAPAISATNWKPAA